MRPAFKSLYLQAFPPKGVKLNGEFASIDSGSLYTQIEKILPALQDRGELYKGLDKLRDGLEALRSATGGKLSESDTRYIGEAKVAMTNLRHALVQVSKQTGLSYKI